MKMILSTVVEIPIWLSLAIIVGVLAIAAAASALRPVAEQPADDRRL